LLNKRLRSGGAVTFAYDAPNRATSAVYPAGKGQSIYWGYDLLNRGLYANYGSATGPGVSYAYDALGRVTSETSVNRTLTYQYDAAGNRTRMTWPDTGANALYVAYVYDVLNRVTMVEENGATSGPGLLASYGYDSLGRRSTLARAGGAGAATGYTYDGASRLYTLTQTLAGSASVTYTLGYNAASQIVSKQVSNSAYVAHPGSITAGYVANGLNQYTSATGITASYVPANSAALSYDPAGRLQTETTAGATISLLYSGDALVGEYDSSGNIIARYAMGPGVDEPLVWYQGAGTTTRNWLTADNQGSVIGYADQGGNAGATYTYGPYGEPIASGGASAWGGSRYRYTGQIEIPEAQLYYYKARVYDPNLGRFQQTDPAGLTSDTNLYAYATQDPVNGSDPSGMDVGGTDPDLQCENGCGVESPGVYISGSYDWIFWTECQAGSPGDGSCGITVTPASYLGPLPTFDLSGGPQGGGSGGGAGGKEPQSNTCAAALRTAGQTSAAVARANSSMSTLSQAASANGIDPALLAAIGVRETGFQNVAQVGGGGGMGVFQLTNQRGVSAAQAFNLSFSANYAAGMLSSNMASLSSAFPSFTSSQLLQATAASYNFGLTNISGNPNTIDVGTTGGNYGSNVVGLMSCFSH
jgi:RHS repeat-associated protein